jgi:phosphatidylglycerophosphate synthase
MKIQIAIPTAISSLRVAALPLFFYLYGFGNVAACLGLLMFCAATDYLDGYFARRLGVASKFGAYYDATTDFALVIGVFALFTFQGLYPFWLVLLISVAFIQFIVTSVCAKKLYDPVGRHLGSALYIGIALTLLFPTQATYNFVQYAFVMFLLVSLASRSYSLMKKPTKK